MGFEQMKFIVRKYQVHSQRKSDTKFVFFEINASPKRSKLLTLPPDNAAADIQTVETGGYSFYSSFFRRTGILPVRILI